MNLKTVERIHFPEKQGNINVFEFRKLVNNTCYATLEANPDHLKTTMTSRIQKIS